MSKFRFTPEMFRGAGPYQEFAAQEANRYLEEHIVKCQVVYCDKSDELRRGDLWLATPVDHETLTQPSYLTSKS